MGKFISLIKKVKNDRSCLSSILLAMRKDEMDKKMIFFKNVFSTFWNMMENVLGVTLCETLKLQTI